MVIASPTCWNTHLAWGQEMLSSSPSIDEGTIQSPGKLGSHPSEKGVEEANSLKQLLTRFAFQSVRSLRPDVRNGLIRVAVMTARGKDLDLATRQAISTELALIIAEQPNILILEPSREREVMERFDRLGLELSDNRSISLGQHLGVRYVINLFVESAPKGGVILKTKTIGIKRRGLIDGSENEGLISLEELKNLQRKSIFYESKIEATWRSALIPGWGQLYQGRTGAAIAYMSLSAALLMGGILANQAGNEAAQVYQENTSDKVYYRQLANSHYARASLLWGGLSVTWLSSTLSAYFQGEDRAHVKFNFDPQQGSFNLSGVF